MTEGASRSDATEDAFQLGGAGANCGAERQNVAQRLQPSEAGADRKSHGAAKECFMNHRRTIVIAFLFLCLLLPRAKGASPVVISEFMASNTGTVADEDGQFSDWIELHNVGGTTVNLLNWALSNNPGDSNPWRFPATNLTADAYLVVFASGKDRHVAGAPLHTDFKLTAAGEYLALIEPDGVTIATEFSPLFPPQVPDVSFGSALLSSNSTLIAAGMPLRAFVPSVANGGAGLNYSWTGAETNEPFADDAWRSGPAGVGFSGGTPLVGADAMTLRFNFDAPPSANVIVDSKPSGTPRNGVNAGATWVASSTDASPTPVTRDGLMQFDAILGNQVTLAASAEFNTNRGTIMFWMRSSGVTGPGQYGAILFDRRANQYTGPGDVIVMQDDGRIFVQAANGATGGINQFATPNAVNDNRWHHLAYVYDQSATGAIAIYIDGVLAQRQNNTAAWSWGPAQEIELGRSYDPFWRRFNGLMDDFRLYNRQLTPAEITAVVAGDGGVAPGDVGLNLQTEMLTINSSAFLRVPFLVDNPSNYSLLNLRMKFDDGYVAWINGQEIARANAADPLDWNSRATNTHASSALQSISLANPSTFLRPGTNILAIQGLNISTTDSTFLILPTLTATAVLGESPAPVYFTSPTPGGPNVGGTSTLGPIIREATHAPNVPRDADDLLVTSRVFPSFSAVSNVLLHYRVMYGAEVSVPMLDDGAHGDGLAGDGVFGASIPQSASTNGQMIRYYISATDVRTNSSRWPLFTDPTSTAQYLGTIVDPTNLTSRLPIFHLFIDPANQAAADSQSGSRCSFFYDGEFYDNIGINLRGNTTAGYVKKSHHYEFNREHLLRHPGPGGRIRQTTTLAEFIDPSYVRHFLSFWLLEQAGHNSPFHYPVRLQNNGVFYQLAYHSEAIGDEQLARFGFDPNGALYKACGVVAVSPCSTGGGPEKKTRFFEPGMADYTALAAAVANTLPLAQRRTNFFDIIDIPDLINYLAVSRLTHEQDDIWANLSLYRDSDGDRMWRVIPFDLNLSWGQLYGVSTIQATNDAGEAVSHPFYGASTVQVPGGGGCGGFNHLLDAVVQLPETRQMFLRRLRSVMDVFLQPPGTPGSQLFLEQKIAALTNLIYPEAILDRQAWGFASGGGGPGALPPAYLTNGVADLINQFINPRRVHLYANHCITNTARPIGLALANNAGIPLSQPPNLGVTIASVEVNPSSGNQLEEFICLTNPAPIALDLSNWKLDGAVHFTFKPGTVMPSNSVLYLSPDVVAFRARSTAPRGGQGLFIVGNYQGQLSARGETLRLLDPFGQVAHTFTYPGQPSLAQQFLRITEMMYHPAPLAGNTNSAEEFEFIELKNLSTNQTLNLAGVRLTDGIDFNFGGSPVTSLAPGQTVLVVKNLPAFRARYGEDFIVAGQYGGYLDNGGERLRLIDATGEEILDFSYDHDWYPMTDGFGFSLVVRDEQAEPDAWSNRSNWRASGTLGGSPAAEDPGPPEIAPVVINEALTRTDVPPPTDSIELYNPTGRPVDLAGWFLSDDFHSPKKFRIPNGTTIAAGGYLVFDEAQFNPGGAGFALSADGDEVWLFSADPAGNLTGYFHGFTFGAAEDGVSFGRYLTSLGQEHFVAQTARTLNATNAGPKVGPIVITEIMYRPPDLADGSDNHVEEFIELFNITAGTVELFDPSSPTNQWRLAGGIDFVFPPNQVLSAGGYLLLVGFDPSTNAAMTAGFRTRYHLDPNVPLFGPYRGKLDNSSDRIELQKPTTALPGTVPYVRVDRVDYADSTPWPAAADGCGASLQRLNSSAYGDDPVNWIAASPTPGAPRSSGGVPPAITSQPASQTVIATTDASLAVTATGTGPLGYQWRQNGANLIGATNSVLTFNRVQASQAGQYTVLVYNSAGSTESSNATLNVRYAAFVVQHPASVQLRGSTNGSDYGFTTNSASFSVVAVGTGLLRYQWRFNGADLPGQTGPSLTVANVDLAKDGIYDVRITDDVGAVLSNPARLTVLVSPMLVQAPLDQNVVSNGHFTASVVIKGNPPPFRYEWREISTTKATNISNQTTNYFTSGPITNLTARTWRLVILNAANSAPGLLSQFTVSALADTDRDGLPDAYEQAVGLNPNEVTDALGDLDHDGVSNRDEYLAGTDPNDPNSYLRLDLTTTPGLATLELAAVSNRTYSVQFNNALAVGPWTRLADIIARPTNHLERVPDPAWTTNRFYRIVTPQQP